MASWAPFVPLLCILAGVSAEDPEVCGCSYSVDKGCSISGFQLVTALKAPKIADKLCESGGGPSEESNTDCRLKDHVLDTVKKTENCLSLTDATECRDYLGGGTCQWAAQKEKACGIDPEWLVVNITNASKEHPFVRWILLTDECSAYSDDKCDAVPHCSWVQRQEPTAHSRGIAHCDIDEGLLFEDMLKYPRLYQMIYLYMQSAICFENRERSPDKCPSPCTSYRGQCYLPKGQDNAVVLQLLEATCGVAAENECSPPCEKRMDGSCTGPFQLPTSLGSEFMNPEDEQIAHALMILSGATNTYHEQCSQHTPQECAAIKEQCRDADHHPGVGKTFITTFGLSDAIAKLVDAAQNKSLIEKVDKYLKKYPESGQKALKSLVGGFNHVLAQQIDWSSPTPAPPAKEEGGGNMSGTVLIFFGLICALAACVGLAYGQVTQRLGLDNFTQRQDSQMYKRAP